MEPSEWVLLAYRLPREPSTPRITVWRKLRRLGAVQLVDGLVALPSSPRTQEHLDWLADEVVDAGGEAWTWAAVPRSKAQQRALVDRAAAAAAADYRAVVDEVERLAAEGRPPRRTVARLRRELGRIEARDFFPGDARETARRAVSQLVSLVEEAAP